MASCPSPRLQLTFPGDREVVQQSKAISTVLSFSKGWESSFLLPPGNGFEGRVEGDTNVEAWEVFR